mmetsp:Transcript_116280/g.182935  ORF Transcript_116280/g.182935 Transcript_116280/m.182935 type:complete len:224 (+) Transcript_116280:595-1266(+)
MVVASLGLDDTLRVARIAQAQLVHMPMIVSRKAMQSVKTDVVIHNSACTKLVALIVKGQLGHTQEVAYRRKRNADLLLKQADLSRVETKSLDTLKHKAEKVLQRCANLARLTSLVRAHCAARVVAGRHLSAFRHAVPIVKVLTAHTLLIATNVLPRRETLLKRKMCLPGRRICLKACRASGSLAYCELCSLRRIYVAPFLLVIKTVMELYAPRISWNGYGQKV